MVDQYAAWRNALATNTPVPYEKGNPASGFYRVRARNKDRSIRFDAVAIWRDQDGVQCARTGPFPAPTHLDEIEELFVNCNSSPISDALYYQIADGGTWPDDVAPVEVADDLPPNERAEAELTAQREAMAAWFKEIGGKIADKTTADKAGNFADEFAKIEKKATADHKVEKEPFLEGGRIVDAKWKPIIERAKELKTWAKESTTPYLKAEKARIAAEEKARADAIAAAEREANRKRIEAQDAGLPPPPVVAPAQTFAPPPQTAKAGKVHLRSETVYVVEDPAAFLRWLSTQNNLPEDFLATLKTLGTRMMKAGLTPDGIVTRTEERAA